VNSAVEKELEIYKKEVEEKWKTHMNINYVFPRSDKSSSSYPQPSTRNNLTSKQS
jgi:hypothetical protein